MPGPAARRPALLLLPLLAAAAQGLREASRRLELSDHAALLDLPKYKVGEFMQYQFLEGPQAGEWVKCSITGIGDLQDTYNIYVWGADPKSRHLKNIPEEVLRSQAEEDAKQRVIDREREAKERREKLERLKREEAERKERELRLLRQQAKEAADRKAAADAEILRKAQEEEDARVRAEEEKLRLEREAAERVEAARLRKIRLKARWEEVKAIRAKEAAEAKAKEDEARARREEEELRQKVELEARIARGEVVTTSAPPELPHPKPEPLADPQNIQVTLKMDGKPTLFLKARRNLRLRSLMSVAADKMGVDPAKVRFSVGNRVYSPEETAERFGPHDRITVHMSPISKREVTTLHLESARTGVVSFEVGDFALVNASGPDGKAQSLPCTVRAKGGLPDTYDVHFVFTSGSVQDVADVPAKWMQKVGGKRYAADVKKLREDSSAVAPLVQHVAHAAEAAARAARRRQAALEPAAPAAEKAKAKEAEVFEVDNLVQYVLQDGSAAPFTVTAANGEDRYDLRALFAPAAELRGLRDLRGVPAQRLRRLRAGPYVQAVRRLKEDPAEAQRVLELAAREMGSL